MADHQMSLLSVLNILYHTYITLQKFGKAGGTPDPQGRIKGSRQVLINFSNSANIARRAFKLGLYIQSTFSLIVYIFWKDWTTGSDRRGVSI